MAMKVIQTENGPEVVKLEKYEEYVLGQLKDDVLRHNKTVARSISSSRAIDCNRGFADFVIAQFNDIDELEHVDKRTFDNIVEKAVIDGFVLNNGALISDLKIVAGNYYFLHKAENALAKYKKENNIIDKDIEEL